MKLFRLVSIMICFVMLLVSFTGCENKKESQSVSQPEVKMEDLPYGATMQTDETNYPFTISYDKRFFEPEEIKAITDYFYSIETKDEEVYKNRTVSSYMDYIVEQMYQNLIGIDGIMVQQNDEYNKAAGGEFTIAEVEISEYDDKTEEGSDLYNLYEMLNALNNDEKYTDEHIANSKYFKYNITLQGPERKATQSDRTMFIVCEDGTYKVCP